jgi:hypothetical protein
MVDDIVGGVWRSDSVVDEGDAADSAGRKGDNSDDDEGVLASRIARSQSSVVRLAWPGVVVALLVVVAKSGE